MDTKRIVTKAMLDQLRAERLRPRTHLDCTPEGPLKIEVISQVESARHRQIAKGEHTLQEALQALQRDQALAAREGLARAHFNTPKQEIEL